LLPSPAFCIADLKGRVGCDSAALRIKLVRS
jgi:hypothetical protein